MTLGEVIDRLEELDAGLMICARRPWNDDAESVIVTPTEEWGVPQSLKEQGFEYFMGVVTALEATSSFRERGLTKTQLRELIIYFAENDSYPEWVFDDEHGA